MATDYILRLIEQMGAMLAGIIMKLKGGEYPAARIEIDRICLEQLGLSIGELKRRSPERIAEHLGPAGPMRTQRSVLLAELFLRDAELCDRDANAAAALVSRMHALCLLTDVIGCLERQDQTAYRVKIEDISAQLGHVTAHPYLAGKLRGGAYQCEPEL